MRTEENHFISLPKHFGTLRNRKFARTQVFTILLAAGDSYYNGTREPGTRAGNETLRKTKHPETKAGFEPF